MMTTVLIVEDELSLLELMEQVLTDAGYTVVIAHNGQEALATVVTTPPDLIISDIMMPVMDGYALLRAVRSRAMSAKVILTSAASLDKEHNPQPDLFVAKPYDLDRLEALVAQITDAK